ncbi:unnamed protein product [Ilex paraguariensis]|uniref:Uncharacterized protein n=1 Tax=Ilex paraguariensis TaxID=185542 RepID=A0ABC8TQ53_9AQUA
MLPLMSPKSSSMLAKRVSATEASVRGTAANAGRVTKAKAEVGGTAEKGAALADVGVTSIATYAELCTWCIYDVLAYLRRKEKVLLECSLRLSDLRDTTENEVMRGM